MNWDKIYDTIINKLHVVLGCVTQGTLIVYHFHSGKDLGPGLVSTVYAFYGFLLGHAATYQKWPDKDDDGDGK